MMRPALYLAVQNSVEGSLSYGIIEGSTQTFIEKIATFSDTSDFR